ncbi:MAG: hypothetical protein ABMB14_36575 [Myxococcota bacterium]
MATYRRWWAAAALGVAVPAGAQLGDGTDDVVAYDIVLDHHRLGWVVIVGADHAPIAGFAAGQEHWAWFDVAFPAAFALVPRDTLPGSPDAVTDRFPHDRFDLSATVPMPAVELGPTDRFYRVAIREPSQWLDQGWLWQLGGSPRDQVWFGAALERDRIGGGRAIRFVRTDPPPPGSVDVFLVE